jgi:hypothetical protein
MSTVLLTVKHSNIYMLYQALIYSMATHWPLRCVLCAHL